MITNITILCVLNVMFLNKQKLQVSINEWECVLKLKPQACVNPGKCINMTKRKVFNSSVLHSLLLDQILKAVRMGKNLLLLFCAVMAVLVKDVNAADDKNCKTAVSEMLKYQMQAISKCTKELGFKGKEKTEKMNCIMKCVLISSGAIKPDGNIEIESAMSFVLEFIPVDFLEKALKGSMKCQRFMGQLDPNEANCKSYEPLVKCLTGFIMSLCSK